MQEENLTNILKYKDCLAFLYYKLYFYKTLDPLVAFLTAQLKCAFSVLYTIRHSVIQRDIQREYKFELGFKSPLYHLIVLVPFVSYFSEPYLVQPKEDNGVYFIDFGEY